MVEGDDVGDATDRDAGCDDAHCEGSAAREGQADEGHAGDVEKAGGEAHADALGEEDLPVGLGETEHEDAEDHAEVADDEHGAEVA